MLDDHWLLTGKLELDPKLDTFLNKGSWSKSKNYVTMSIIGAQGTGKSTLMNSIFGTAFATKKMDRNWRTTVGADLSIIQEAKNKYFLLIDSEGIGCRERLKDCKGNKSSQSIFETRLTSFILSTVDVLIINIMIGQIGQAEASWQTLVRDIMEINKKFIQTEDTRKKTIIYVIRDYEKERSTEEGLIKTVQSFFDESTENEEEKKADKYSVTKGIKESKKFKEIQNNYNIQFEFMWKYNEGNKDFLKNSKSLKSKIWIYFDEDSKKPEIGSLTSSYYNNLNTIIKNYSYSAEQLKSFYYDMDQAQAEAYDKAEKIIMKFSDLMKLYYLVEIIIKKSIEFFGSKVETELHTNEIFKKIVEDLKKKIRKLWKKKGRALYDKEIKELINFNNCKVQTEMLSSDLVKNPEDFKDMKLKKIENYTWYMKVDKFEIK